MKRKAKRLRICVTRESIEGGTRGSCDACPLALALRMGGLQGARVGWHGIYSNVSYRNKTHHLSPRARDFIEAYDSGRHVKPAVFYATEIT